MLGPGPNPFQSTYRHKSFTRAQTHTLCSVDFPLITLQVFPPTMGGWKDPASPCRHLPCTAVGSSAQSPKTPSIMLEGAVGASTAVPGQSFLQTQGTVGLLILQPPTPPPPSSLSLWGRRLLWGRGWVWGKAGREGGAENQSCIFLCSATSSFLCKVGGGGLRVPTENRVIQTSALC